MNIALIPEPVVATQATYENSESVIELLRPDMPVLCFSRAALAQQAKLFLNRFPGETAYAIKANPDWRVISTLHESGIKVFDVASPAEMELVAHYARGARIHYHNPIKSREEIALAWHQYGCRRFAVDNIDELNKIRQVTGTADNIEIAVRLRLPASASSVHDFSTKFGAAPNEVISLLQACSQRGFNPLVTFHPGSQCLDVQGWVRHIKAVAQIVREAGVKIDKLNIGGGFPAYYCNGIAPALAEIFDVIETATSDAFGERAPALECEPGRALVASCMSLITRVKAVRTSTREVFLNDGIYGSLMESTQAPALTPRHRVFQDNTQKELFTIFGPTCDPLDCLPLPLKLPVNICEGEYVEFLGVGAYASATATGFNGYGKVERVEIS